MMRDVLTDIVTDMLVFLEMSDEHQVNSDAAIQMMEGIAASLQDLNNTDRATVIQQFFRYADSVSNDSPEIAAFVRTLPDVLGIRPEH